MPFKYRCMTANCGNDFLGVESSDSMIKQMLTDDADFYVINCQEAQFGKMLRSLNQAITENGATKLYKIRVLNSMNTMTKPDTLLGGTGLVSYVIYKTDLTINPLSKKSPHRFNKGGIITTLGVLNNQTEESLNIQVISGHLDSFDAVLQNKDWLLIRENMALSRAHVSNWGTLVASTPNICIIGYDANTRMRRMNGPESEPINPWLVDDDMNLLGIQHTLFSNQYSTDTTYEKPPRTNQRPTRRSRAGYIDKGMLDLVGISQSDPCRRHVKTEGVIAYDTETNSRRDHTAILSPLCRYTTLTDFDKVKGQVSMGLAHACPQLSDEILALPDTPENRAFLVLVYRDLLSSDGLLNKLLNLHIGELAKKQPTEPIRWFDVLNTINTSNYHETVQHVTALVDAEKLSWQTRFLGALNRATQNNRQNDESFPAAEATASSFGLLRQDSWDLGVSSKTNNPIEIVIAQQLMAERSYSMHDDPVVAGEKQALSVWLKKYMKSNKVQLTRNIPLSDAVQALLNHIENPENLISQDQWDALIGNEHTGRIISSLCLELRKELTPSDGTSESDDSDLNASEKDELFSELIARRLKSSDSIREYGHSASSDASPSAATKRSSFFSLKTRLPLPPAEFESQIFEEKKRRFVIGLATRKEMIKKTASLELIQAIDSCIDSLRPPASAVEETKPMITEEQVKLLSEDPKINALLESNPDILALLTTPNRRFEQRY